MGEFDAPGCLFCLIGSPVKTVNLRLKDHFNP